MDRDHDDERDLQLVVAGDMRPPVPVQVVVVLSASIGAVRFLWRRLRRGPSEEAATPHNAAPAVKALWRLYAEMWDAQCRRDPLAATMAGDTRNNHRLADLSHEAFEAHLRKLRDVEKRLLRISFSEMTEEQEQVNYLFLKEVLRLEIKAKETFELYEFPTNHLFGPHLLILQLPAIHYIANNGDARQFIQRLRAFETQAAQIIQAFRAGIKNNKVLHLHAVQALSQQCQEQVMVSGTDSVVYEMAVARFRAVGASVDQLRQAIEECVSPAFGRIAEFLRNEYVWEARKEPTVRSFADGNRFYRGCVEYFTSLDVTAEELHNVGKREVARINEKMHKVRRLMGDVDHSSNLDYVSQMKEDGAMFYDSSVAVLNRFQEILEKAEEITPKYFVHMPSTPLVVRAMDEQQADCAPPAHYVPSSDSVGGQPGVLFCNTLRPETIAKHQTVPIALHEGIPGHHLQMALAQETKNVPRLRQMENSWSLSFVQGWALYAEYLGENMGFYDDPQCYFGRLLTEIWRATRLVVDTGLHAMGWSREDAMNYLRSNAFLSDQQVFAEVDRMMTMPGQALAYKVGELRLSDLKDFAERKLGSSFSWAGFHNAVLRSGTVPLSIADRNITVWVSQQLQIKASEEAESGSMHSTSSAGSGAHTRRASRSSVASDRSYLAPSARGIARPNNLTTPQGHLG